MKRATTNTSAIDHLAIDATNRRAPRRRCVSCRNIAHATVAALATGTITLNSRMSVAGTGLPTS
jgi:hypothetical protein